MRRAQAERSRTHAHARRQTQAEEPKHLRHDAHKGRPQAIFAPSFNKAIKREHPQNAKKDEAETSRHALLQTLISFAVRFLAYLLTEILIFSPQ